MRLSTKHPNQQNISFRDFSGGLNTTSAIENLKPNELARALNVCLDRSTGLLRTVEGTDKLFEDTNKEFDCLMIDPWDDSMLMTDRDGNVYQYGNDAITKVGELTGSNSPVYTTWEDGLVIASGGKMQYFHGNTLETISESPAVCNGVFVRDGRVWTWHDDRIVLSGVGDEHNWTHDNNDQSSSQYVDIGYKDRGNIKGIVALSSDVVIFKDNGHAYHLAGQYPDWTIKSIGRQLGIKNYECCLSVGNGVLVLGDGRVQQVGVTEDYGEMTASDISGKVEAEVKAIPGTVRMRFVPSRNEIWFIGNEEEDPQAEFLVFDIAAGAYFHRMYNAVVRDVLSRNETTYILKQHSLCRVSTDNKMLDENEPMEWEFKTMAIASFNQFLLKRVFVDTTPFFDTYVEHKCYFGDVQIFGPLPLTAKSVWENRGVIFGSRRYICDPFPSLVLTETSDIVYNNNEHIWKKRVNVRSSKSYRAETRCVDRRRTVPIKCRGLGGVMLVNQIAFDYAEV